MIFYLSLSEYEFKRFNDLVYHFVILDEKGNRSDSGSDDDSDDDENSEQVTHIYDEIYL